MSEFIDLVDYNGNVVEVGVPRDDASSYNGLFMQIIIATIFNSSGEVNVHERGEGKSYAGFTDLVCGGIESGETPLEAAAKEIYQEAGGVTADDLIVARKGVNEYGRFCWLITGISDDIPDPSKVNTLEVSNPRTELLSTLIEQSEAGKLQLVDGLVTDVRAGWQAINTD